MDAEKKPPSNEARLGIGSRFLPANGALLGRPKSLWELWNSDWGIPPARTALHSRRLLISDNLQEEIDGGHGNICQVVT